jgi:AICAR transformylase/IMP cyclohydrolase PurH
MISQWFAFADQGRLFPEMLAVNGRLVGELRYGENPHQKAALYTPLGPHTRGWRKPSRSRARSSATTTTPTPTPRSS